MTNKIFFVLWAILFAMSSCTDSYFDNSFESKAETEKAIACINNAVSYTKRNESKMLFLTSRNYKWNDLKYGLSRATYPQGESHVTGANNQG